MSDVKMLLCKINVDHLREVWKKQVASIAATKEKIKTERAALKKEKAAQKKAERRAKDESM